METMTDQEFRMLFSKVSNGETSDVLKIIDKEPALATRTNGFGNTLLMVTCNCPLDNHHLVQGLLERGSNVHACNIFNTNALIQASISGHIAIITILLNNGADPDSNNQNYSPLSSAAHYDNLQVCLLLISRGANLMLAVREGTALDRYGMCKRPSLTLAEIEQRREILRNAFIQGPHPDMCWKRRWPIMNIMTGCGFRPLKAKLLELELQRDALFKRGELPPPIVLDSPEKRRAYYMGLIFSCDGLLRLIVSFL
jgi:hypothetical protein